MRSLISGDRVGNFAARQNSIPPLDNRGSVHTFAISVEFKRGERKKKKKKKEEEGRKKYKWEKKMKGKKKRNENAIIGHCDLCEWYWHANETDTTSCTNETNAMLSTISTWKTHCKNIGLFAFLSRKIFLRDINQVKNIEQKKKKKKVGRGSGENI